MIEAFTEGTTVLYASSYEFFSSEPSNDSSNTQGKILITKLDFKLIFFKCGEVYNFCNDSVIACRHHKLLKSHHEINLF